MRSQDSTLPTRPRPEEQRNLLCTILFLDLVGYSARSLNDQARIKERLNTLVTRVLDTLPADSRLAIDTGDGAALCFMGDPQEALRAAMLLRDLLAQRYGNSLPVRIGLHMGPVRVIEDVNGRVNVVGDGINVAQRIMDFAEPGQIVASRACFDIMSRIANGKKTSTAASTNCTFFRIPPAGHANPRRAAGVSPPAPCRSRSLWSWRSSKP